MAKMEALVNQVGGGSSSQEEHPPPLRRSSRISANTSPAVHASHVGSPHHAAAGGLSVAKKRLLSDKLAALASKRSKTLRLDS